MRIRRLITKEPPKASEATPWIWARAALSQRLVCCASLLFAAFAVPPGPHPLMKTSLPSQSVWLTAAQNAAEQVGSIRDCKSFFVIIVVKELL